MNTADKSPRLPRIEILGDGARIMLLIVLSMAILFGLRFASDIILPIIVAGFLAVISYAITDILRRFLRFPHWLAVTSTVFVGFGMIFGLICVVNFLASDLISNLQGDIQLQFTVRFNEFMDFLRLHGLEEQARNFVTSPQDIFDSKQIINITQMFTTKILSLTSLTALVLILMTFFLSEAPLFHRNMERIALNNETKAKIIDAVQGIQRYLFIKTVSSACTGTLAGLLCHYTDVPFAFLWGFLTFVLNYIPTFGSIIAALPPILLALLLQDPTIALSVMIGYVIINFIIGNCIEPLFLGKQFGIATTVVILSVVIWGWVFGPVGMLLAIPMTVLIKLGLESSRDLSWIATLISDDPKPQHLIIREESQR